LPFIDRKGGYALTLVARKANTVPIFV
jgi:hypothetical protein